MKRKLIMLIILIMSTSLTGCCLMHQWKDANYQTPKTCKKCLVTEGEKKIGYFEENGIPCNSELNKEYDFISSAQDIELPLDGKIIINDYKKFKFDATHEAKEDYEWREWTLYFTTSDINAREYGFAIGTGFADYYLGFIDAYQDEDGKFFWGGKYTGNVYEDTVIVNIDGEEYETYIKSIGHIEWEEDKIITTLNMSWLAPVEYDSAIVYVYNSKYGTPDTMEEFTEDIDNSFLFFKLD